MERRSRWAPPRRSRRPEGGRLKRAITPMLLFFIVGTSSAEASTRSSARDAAALVATGDLGSLAQTTVALLVVVFAVVNACVLVRRRERVEHEHFIVPSFIPVIGLGISIALLTQIEAATYARAGILVAVGAVLWIVNWLILRRQGGKAATARPST